MITSDEWAGKLFVLLLIAHTAEGHRILCHTFDKTKRMKEIPDDFGNWPVKDQIRKYQETAEKLNKAERQKKRDNWGTTPVLSQMTMEGPTPNLRRRRKSSFASATGRNLFKWRRLFCASMHGTNLIQPPGSWKPTKNTEPSW